MTRTWEECLEAIQSLGEARLVMRRPRDWYVSQSVEVKDGSCLVGQYGNGVSPEDAVRDHWDRLTALEPGKYVVVQAAGGGRFAVRWNGHMWRPVEEGEAA